jgi:hypothetical protein
MSNIATSIVQSKHLLELGLNPDSADMVWTTANPDLPMLLAYPIEDCNSWNDKVLAWSLSALLEVMPKPDLYRETADLWVCVAFFKEGSIRGFGETAIDAACDNITKMFGCGYLIKKGG